MAQCTAASSLVELSARVHFLIKSMKDEDLLRLLSEVEDSPTTHQAAPLQRSCFSTNGDNYHDITRKN
jgi:hypothetical protein